MPDGARYTFRPSPRFMPNSTAPKCPSCQKAVYAAEQVMGPGGAGYHKSCLRCTSCGRTLDALNLFEHGRDPYCKMCHSKAFGTKGVGYGNAVVGEYAVPTSPASATSRKPTTELSPLALPTSHFLVDSQQPEPSGVTSPLSATVARLNLSDEIPPAGLKVDRRLMQQDDFPPPPPPKPQIPSHAHPSFLEEPSASQSLANLHQTSHHTLESTSRDGIDEVDSAPFTFPTFIIKPKGTTSHLPRPPDKLNLSRASPVPPTRSAATPSPFSSIPPGPSLAPSFSARAFFDDKPASALKPARSASVRVPATQPPRSLAIKSMESPSILSLGSHDGPKLCPRCSSTVYHAEQVLALGKKWHKRCLRCCKCAKALDAAMCEKDGTPYCGKCYDQAFGIEGQGFVVRPGFVGR